MPYPGLLHPEPLPLQQSTADPYPLRWHSNTVLPQSLWGPWVLMCTRYVWALWASLVGTGFDFKCDFAPPTIFLGLLLCPWTNRSVVSDSLQPQGLYSPWNSRGRILEWVTFVFSRGSSWPRIEPRSPALQVDSLPAEPQGKQWKGN